MDRLEPIPSPPGHLIREFCHRVLPIAVFLGAIGLTATLWNQRFTGTTVFGEVETIQADVITPEAGTLIDLRVDRFDEVTNGQVIATLRILDPDRVKRDLAVLRSELEVVRARMALDEARNDQNVEGIRAQWLEARVDLATARVNLENARRDLERSRQLRTENIIAEAEFDLAQSVHDALSAEVAERTTAVEGLAQSVDRLGQLNSRDRGSAMDVVSESLTAQERSLAAQSTVTLESPMDGVIKVVNHRVLGERVPLGAVLAVITARQSQRIVGYVRQPLNVDPKPGMEVEIRTRGPQRQTARSHVLRVGTDLELVVSPLRLRGFDNSVERGLPFWVHLPAELAVHPGELVDLTVFSPTQP